MRTILAFLIVCAISACGPETVRATGAPTTAASATTVATATRTPAPTTTTATATSPSPATATPARPTGSATQLPTAAPPSPSPGATPALASCASESSLRGQPTSATAPLLVVNDAGARRDLSALDGNGKRFLARSLAPGDSYTQTTRMGEVYVITEPQGGCVAVYLVVAAALLIVSPSRNSIIPLYAIRGRATDARSGAALGGQTVFIWKPDETSCAVIGGTGAPGYVVSSITAPDGTYGVHVTAGDYKVRVRTSPVGGLSYAAQWWRGKPAITAGQCAAADVLTLSTDLLAIDFALQPE